MSPPRPRGPARPPPSVRVAVAALFAAFYGVAYLVLQAGEGRPGWPQIAFAALIAALLLGGLLARSRLAWLWGHSLAPLLAALQAFAVGYALYRGVSFGTFTLLVMTGIVLCLLVAFVSLGRRSALGWFDLVCPSCRSPVWTGADLLFRRARCRKCGTVW